MVQVPICKTVTYVIHKTTSKRGGKLYRESGWKVTCGPAGKTISYEQADEIVNFKLSNQKFGNQTFD